MLVFAYFCLVFYQKQTFANSFELFSGDLSLDNYIEKYVCATQEAKSKWSYVYVHQLQLLNESHQNKQELNSSIFYFSKNHLSCFSAVYRQINKATLLDNLNSKYCKHTEVLVIINLSSSSSSPSSSSSNYLASTLSQLNTLYIDCRKCLPFLLLAPSNARKILNQALTSAQLNFTFPLRSVLTFPWPSQVTVHLNPTLDGCSQQLHGLYYPQNVADFRRLQTRKCHLNSSHLTVAINEDMSFCNLFFGQSSNQQIDHPRMSGSEVDLLRLLQTRFHFSSRLLYSDEIYGAKFNSQIGSWTGVVGHVYSGTAHFGLCGLTDTLGRRQYVDFTSFTQMDSNAPITRYPRLRGRQWLAVEPFSGSVWLCFAASFAIAIASLLVSKRATKLSCQSISYFRTFEELYRILLKNCKYIFQKNNFYLV